jgi:hypothetical protein
MVKIKTVLLNQYGLPKQVKLLLFLSSIIIGNEPPSKLWTSSSAASCGK